MYSVQFTWGFWDPLEELGRRRWWGKTHVCTHTFLWQDKEHCTLHYLLYITPCTQYTLDNVYSILHIIYSTTDKTGMYTAPQRRQEGFIATWLQEAGACTSPPSYPPYSPPPSPPSSISFSPSPLSFLLHLPFLFPYLPYDDPHQTPPSHPPTPLCTVNSLKCTVGSVHCALNIVETVCTHYTVNSVQ